MLIFSHGTIVLQGGKPPELEKEGRWCNEYI
jgi:hypothetical protein